MTSTSSSTAILVFLREAASDAHLKKWFAGAGYRKNLQGTALVNRKAISLARRTGLPTIVIQGREQRGTSFGERFAHAIQDVFAKGYKQVIAIGNDCLGMTEMHLLGAADALEKGKPVLGPDESGGVYLVGISHQQFDPVTWAKLPWQSSSLFHQLRIHLASSNYSAVLLEKQIDANSQDQFLDSLALIQAPILLAIIFRILFGENAYYFTFGSSGPSQIVLIHPSLRAPPTAG